MTDLQGDYTLLDVVNTVSEFSDTEEELLATVTYLVNSGKVRLCGNFAGSTIAIPAPHGTQLGAA